jgi:hypothetical protein
MLYKYGKYLCTKTYQFKLCVKDDNYGMPVQPQISNFRPTNVAKRALMCYGGSTHESLLSESCHSYMLTYYLSVCIATVQIF